MDRLRAEPDLRATLGARGRRTVLEKWTTNVHLERYLSLVTGFLDERPEDVRRPATRSQVE